MTEWAEAKGAWLAAGRWDGAAPQSCSWAVGSSPRVLPANPEVLYSLSCVSALCYCFSLFIKCVWITVEMLWFIFFFSIKILNWVWKVRTKSAACCFLGICLVPYHTNTALWGKKRENWVPPPDSNSFITMICQDEYIIRFWSRPWLRTEKKANWSMFLIFCYTKNLNFHIYLYCFHWQLQASRMLTQALNMSS